MYQYSLVFSPKFRLNIGLSINSDDSVSLKPNASLLIGVSAEEITFLFHAPFREINRRRSVQGTADDDLLSQSARRASFTIEIAMTRSSSSPAFSIFSFV